MSDKYIIVAGRQVPIPVAPDKNVFVHTDSGSMNFYTPQDVLSPDRLAQMAILRPTLRNFSFRRALNGQGFTRDKSQLFDVPQAELDALGQSVFQIAIHHDVTNSAKSTFEVLCTRGLSTHFVVNNNGDLYQFMDCYHCAWATGDNNNRCIAIDLNNPVFTDVSYDGPRRDIFQGKVNGSLKTMLGYTEEQYETFIALMKAFITPIPTEGGEPWIPFPRIAENCFPPVDQQGDLITRLLSGHLNFVGFLGHFHCSANKWDPGPALDWFRVLSGLKGERNSFPVILEPGGPNIGNLNGMALSRQFEAYYDNAESSPGGWYPIGVNQSWHSGIHLSAPEGTPVLNMIKGHIVAVRSTPRVSLGDPSFVLVRHEKEFPPGKDETEALILHWYTLYMHLSQVDDRYADRLPWLQTLLNGSIEPPEDYQSLFFVSDIDNRPPEVFDATQPSALPADIKRAFYDGKIVIANIPVNPEDTIGFFGKFLQSSSYDPDRFDESYLTDCIHLECFSEHNIVRNAATSPQDSEAWTIVEGDPSPFSLLKIRKIIQPVKDFIADANPNADLKKFLKSSEISKFFVEATSEKYAFRQMICYHRSEWSPLTNWTKTAVLHSGWPWQSERNFGQWLLAYLPFRWMTDEALSALNIKSKEHAFYTYHPLYMLQQLNSSYSEVIPPNAEAASEDEINVNLAESKKKLDELLQMNTKLKNGKPLSAEENERYKELYAQMDDHLDDGDGDISRETRYEYETGNEFNSWEPGEWPVPGRF